MSFYGLLTPEEEINLLDAKQKQLVAQNNKRKLSEIALQMAIAYVSSQTKQATPEDFFSAVRSAHKQFSALVSGNIS